MVQTRFKLHPQKIRATRGRDKSLKMAKPGLWGATKSLVGVRKDSSHAGNMVTAEMATIRRKAIEMMF